MLMLSIGSIPSSSKELWGLTVSTGIRCVLAMTLRTLSLIDSDIGFYRRINRPDSIMRTPLGCDSTPASADQTAAFNSSMVRDANDHCNHILAELGHC